MREQQLTYKEIILRTTTRRDEEFRTVSRKSIFVIPHGLLILGVLGDQRHQMGKAARSRTCLAHRSSESGLAGLPSTGEPGLPDGHHHSSFSLSKRNSNSSSRLNHADERYSKQHLFSRKAQSLQCYVGSEDVDEERQGKARIENLDQSSLAKPWAGATRLFWNAARSENARQG